MLAVKEYHARRAVGIERLKSRAKRAKNYVKQLELSDRVEIRHQDFRSSKLADATVVYTGLTESEDDLMLFESKLRDGCVLVTLALPLVGIVPNDIDYPFYLMRKPFIRTRNLSKWIASIISTCDTFEQFLFELRNDPDYDYDMRTLKKLIKQRLTEIP